MLVPPTSLLGGWMAALLSPDWLSTLSRKYSTTGAECLRRNQHAFGVDTDRERPWFWAKAEPPELPNDGEETSRWHTAAVWLSLQKVLPLSVQCWCTAGKHGHDRGSEPAVPAGFTGQPLQKETVLLRGLGETTTTRSISSSQIFALRQQEACNKCLHRAHFWKFPGPSQLKQRPHELHKTTEGGVHGFSDF